MTLTAATPSTPAPDGVAGGHRTRVVIAGPPGCGKGTQAPRLAERLGVPHVSTGDLLRDEVRSRSAIGAEVAATMDRGGLLSDSIVLTLIGNRLTQDDAREGFVLDGFPRTSEQARALCNLMGNDGIDVVVELTVGSEELLRRLAQRVVCSRCGRTAVLHATGRCVECGGSFERRHDDETSAVQRRLAAYRCYTEPMLHWFERRGLLVRVAGGLDPELVARTIDAVVGIPVG